MGLDYIISGLSPNTKYSIKTRIRRKDSQLWTESGLIYGTTKDIAKITSAPNVNIGASQKIEWTNPAGATISLKFCKTDGTTLVQDFGTVTGTSKTVAPTANKIYELTPNSNTITLRYILTTTANSTSYTSYKDCVFSVTNSNPDFSNFVYADVGTDSTVLTGNNQIVINGFNVIKVTISVANKAVAKNSATMSKYRLVCGTQQVEANYSSSSDVVLRLENVKSNTLTVYAIDSRGNSTEKSISVANFKNYTDIVIASGKATRTGGVGTETTLEFEGKIWNESFGAVINTITECTYKYKKTNTSSYTNGETAINPTISNGKFAAKLLIKGDEGANGFNVSNSYDIVITVKDKIRTAPYSLILGTGKPGMAIHKNGVSFGSPYDEQAGGALQIEGMPVLEYEIIDEW